MSYVNNAQDTLIINGIDIKSLSNVVINSIEYFSPSKRRGNNDSVAGRRGQLSAPKPLDAYSFSVHAIVQSTPASSQNARRAQFISNLRGFIKALQGTGGQSVIQRRLQIGASTYVTHECNGEFVATNAFEFLNYVTGKVELEFINLDGVWYDTSYTTISSPGSVSINGDYPSRKTLVTFSGAATLANSTSGTSVTVTTASVLDTFAYTATAGLSTLSHTSGDTWFELAPGTNVLTGAASIQYKAAWL